MTKIPKKVKTNDKCIDEAESKLGIKYPELIREKLKETNGFDWGYYSFYCVFDEEDKFHTLDDVVKQNENLQSGWKMYLPEGYVAIANTDLFVLALSKEKDGKVYEYNHETGQIEVFANNDDELGLKLLNQEFESEE